MTTKISYKTRKKKRKIWKRKKDERVVTYLCPIIFVLGLNFIWNFKGREYEENLENPLEENEANDSEWEINVILRK